MASPKRYFSSTSWLFIEKIVSIVSSLFVGAYVAKSLGPQDFGSYSYIILIYGVLLPLSKFGIDSTYYVEVMKDKSKVSEIFPNALLARIYVSMLIFVFSLIYVALFDVDHYVLIVSASVILSFTSLVEVTQQVRVKSEIIAQCRIFQLLISSIIKLFIVENDLSYYYLFYILIFDSFFIFILYYIFIIKGFNCTWSFSFQSVKYFYKVSFFVFLSSICTVLYARLDSFMIYSLLGEEALGIYSVAVRLSESWLFIPMILSSSLFPAVYKYAVIDKSRYHEKLELFYVMMAVIGFAALMGAFAFSDYFVHILFGAEFAESSEVLKIRIVETLFAGIGVAANKWVVSEGLQKKNFVFVLIGLVTNVVLNSLFIPIYGVKGAAYASVIAILTTVLIAPSFDASFRRDVKIRIKALLIFPVAIKYLRSSI